VCGGGRFFFPFYPPGVLSAALRAAARRFPASPAPTNKWDMPKKTTPGAIRYPLPGGKNRLGCRAAGLGRTCARRPRCRCSWLPPCSLGLGLGPCPWLLAAWLGQQRARRVRISDLRCLRAACADTARVAVFCSLGGGSPKINTKAAVCLACNTARASRTPPGVLVLGIYLRPHAAPCGPMRPHTEPMERAD
jgi:hypothetical protein